MKENPLRATDLEFAARIDRPLIHAEGKSVRFLVVDVKAPVVAEKGEAKAPINLALVIDASGSMQGDPIEAAKQSARLVAGRLGADDRLSVVSFDDEVATHVEGMRQDAAGRQAAERAIGALHAGSCTNLGGGWLRGCECVAKVMEAHSGWRNRVVLLSDGMANRGITDPSTLAAHADALRLRGVLSSAVGIGEQYSDAQLEAITASGGGRLHHANDPEEIVQLVLAELEESRATVVERCELVIALPDGFRAEVVGDFAVTRAAKELKCAMGSLPSGGSRSAVFKITCAPGAVGDAAAIAVGARWTAVGVADAFEVESVACTLEFASAAACLAQPRDAGLTLRVARTWQLAVVRAATRLNQDGELERAAKLVEHELKYFVPYCEGLPEAESLVAPLRRMGQSVGEVVWERISAKEMLTFSRKGMRSEREHRQMPQTGWEDHLPRP